MKAFKVFIKPYEAPRKSVKIKILLNLYFNATFGNARDVMIHYVSDNDQHPQPMIYQSADQSTNQNVSN